MTDTADALRLHLLQCGFVDPDDDTVPIFTGSDPHFAWTSVDKLVAALLARFEIRDRQAAPQVFFAGDTVPAESAVMDGDGRVMWSPNDWTADANLLDIELPSLEERQAAVDRARAEREEA